MTAKSRKHIVQQTITYGRKQAKSVENPDSYLSKHPSWRFERADTGYRWDISTAVFSQIIQALTNFERMTWDEINKQTHDNGKSSNHLVCLYDLSKEAQNRFTELKLGEYADQIYSLRLMNKTRIYGILRDGILSVLWYDEKHEIYPSEKKHT